MPIKSLDEIVEPAGIAGVFLIEHAALAREARPALIGGLQVTAVAPHPQLDDLVYVTTSAPATLDFLPDPYFDLDSWDRGESGA